MSKLRAELPNLSEHDYRLALYSFAGFSNRAIALFIDSDPVSVSKFISQQRSIGQYFARSFP